MIEIPRNSIKIEVDLGENEESRSNRLKNRALNSVIEMVKSFFIDELIK